jgi:hypothetical protein
MQRDREAAEIGGRAASTVDAGIAPPRGRPDGRVTLLHQAVRLVAAAESLAAGSRSAAPLRGRHVAVVAGVPGRPGGDYRLDAIEAAAAKLGARTARPALPRPAAQGDLVMLAGFYDLVCSDAALDDLAPRLRQLGLPVVQQLMDPAHAVALVALLLALRRRIPAGATVEVYCPDQAQAPAASLLTDAAAMLGMPLRTVDAAAPGNWTLVAAAGGYPVWRLQAPAAADRDPEGWPREQRLMRELALQAALLQAVA